MCTLRQTAVLGLLGGAVCGLLAGCVPSAITPGLEEPALPDAFVQQPARVAEQLTWAPEALDAGLVGLLAEAVANNHALAQQAAVVAQARADARIARADRLPGVSAGLDGSRGRSSAGAPVAEAVSADLALSWQLDPWGQLRDRQRAAWLALAAAEARLNDARRRLAANVLNSWYEALGARQLLDLFQQRLDNLLAGQEIIERGYERGLNGALDLYLARNATQQQRASVAAQQAALQQAVASLQTLLGRHPSGQARGGDLMLDRALPDPLGAADPAVPASLLQRRADLQQAWLDVLAADASRAAAVKERFPAVTLVAGSSDSQGRIGALFNSSDPAWSLVGSLSQPLFQGGRLRARADRAGAQLDQAEARWLAVVQSAAGEVEAGLSDAGTLDTRYAALLQANANAEAAYTLSFDQYQRGLVDYTTVLEAQRRAFDTGTQVVQLRTRQLQNRITLYLALGGPF